jgi:DNA-directed RNA polymerase subunit alpha
MKQPCHPRTEGVTREAFDALEVWAGKVQIEMARGNWEAAHQHVDAAREEIDVALGAEVDPLNLNVQESGLSIRTANSLEERGIPTLAELLECRTSDLLLIPNFGNRTVSEIDRVLKNHRLVRIT